MTYPLGHYGILRFVSESNSTDTEHESKTNSWTSPWTQLACSQKGRQIHTICYSIGLVHPISFILQIFIP